MSKMRQIRLPVRISIMFRSISVRTTVVRPERCYAFCSVSIFSLVRPTFCNRVEHGTRQTASFECTSCVFQFALDVIALLQVGHPDPSSPANFFLFWFDFPSGKIAILQ